MKLHLQSDSGVTLIENIFIDRYMPAANGEFVKLYLYLLRCAGTGRELSVSSIADFFNHTENDVKRALSYWEKANLLRLHYDADGGISDIVFLRGDEEEESFSFMVSPMQGNAPQPAVSANAADDMSVPASAGSDKAVVPADAVPAPADMQVPPRSLMTAARRRELGQQEEMQQLIFVASTYIGRPLTTTEINNLLYFYDILRFSSDLIEYLIEYCATKGNPGARYMEKVAVEWYRKGIRTVQEAKEESSLFNPQYYQIMDAIGLGGRKPARRETEYMDRWLNEWGFSMELIREACSRAVLSTGKPSLNYADGILKKWHQYHVTNEQDIKALDAQHETRRNAEAAKTAQRQKSGAGRAPAGSFGNFSQRSYDMKSLEKQLLKTTAAGGDNPSGAAGKGTGSGTE